jgi:glycolate oxidase
MREESGMMKSYEQRILQIIDKDRINTDPLELLCYSRDMSVHRGTPDMLVFPVSTTEVSEIMRVAAAYRVPVTVRGAGTSVTGAILPIHGGILMDMSRMNRIVEINRNDLYAVVQPGVVCQTLNEELYPDALFAPDPGSSVVCTIGGMVATNASGLRAVKYGTTRDHVKGLEVVLASGEVIRTGAKTPKSSSGYDLTGLFVNSEGTLGIFTEIMVKIIPRPEYTALAVSYFDEMVDAGRAASSILMKGIPLSVCEFIDRMSIGVVNQAMGLGLPEVGGMLIMEVDGSPVSVGEEMEKIVAICSDMGGKDVRWTDDPSERMRIWKGRSGLVSSLSRFKEGSRLIPIAEDFGVPISKIPDALEGISKIAEKNDILIATFGHAGDGNIHSTFICDVRDRSHWEKIRNVGHELIELSIDLGGTVTAEHGTGLAKAPFAPREWGRSLDVMRQVKGALDPDNILNPGKLSLDGKDVDIYDHFAFKSIIDSPEQISSFGGKVDNEILACVQCGICRSACPVFSQTGLESTNARGKLVLAYSLFSGELEGTPELAERLFQCTSCMSCTVNCPSRIKVVDVVNACRSRMSEEGFTLPQHRGVLENLATTANPYGLPPEERTEILPDFAAGREIGGPMNTEDNILLFMGCMPAYVDMKILPKSVEILEKAGVNYTILGKGEQCCGYIAHLIGDSSFEGMARSLTEKFRKSGVRTIVTPCAGCCKTFRELYPKTVDFDFEVLHLVEYIDRIARDGALTFGVPIPRRVAYHDPCDLGRHLGVYEPPRRLLSRIPELELVEFPRNREFAACCGGGGAMQNVNPALSIGIARQRIMEGIGQNAEIIASACAMCKDNLRKGLFTIDREVRGTLRIMDVLELVAASVK